MGNDANPKRLSRRNFIRGAGGAVLSLPFLECATRIRFGVRRSPRRRSPT